MNYRIGRFWRALAACSAAFSGFRGSSLPHASTYVLSDKSKNIEALLECDPNTDAFASCLSIRYAGCQPEAATEAFLGVVGQIAEGFCLQIKLRRSSLFEQDTEEVVLSVAESWRYFIAKHPQALRSRHQLVG